MYIYTYVYIHTYMYIYMYIHIYLCMCVYIYSCIRMYIYTFIYLYLSSYSLYSRLLDRALTPEAAAGAAGAMVHLGRAAKQNLHKFVQLGGTKLLARVTQVWKRSAKEPCVAA